MGNSHANTCDKAIAEQTSNSWNTTNAEQRSQRRNIHSTSAALADTDPWWWQVENENLILENVVSFTVPKSRNELEISKSVKKEKAVIENSERSERTVRLKAQTFDEFQKEFLVKRHARQTAVQNLRDEIVKHRQIAAEQAQLNGMAKIKEGTNEDDHVSLNEIDHIDEDVIDGAQGGLSIQQQSPGDSNGRSRHAECELANVQLELQLANADNISLRSEISAVQRQVGSLKDVITCCKQMLLVKEEQCTQLKTKLHEIESSFNEREAKLMSSNLRQEYERQLVNIRQLRQLYEERQRVAAAEYENLQRLISIKKDELLAEKEKTKDLEDHNKTLLNEIDTANNELAALRDECKEHKFEKWALKEEIATVNTLFSQMVMGFSGENSLDIDRLGQMLEENRVLLIEITQREGQCFDGATLPKLLFELVQQAANAEPIDRNLDDLSTLCKPEQEQNDAKAADIDCVDSNNDEKSATKITNQDVNKRRHKKRVENFVSTVPLQCYEPEVIGEVASAQEIVTNLSKVWKVLMELLSHHKQRLFKECTEDCYKLVETPSGTKKELSLSKTYIRLKDLILEKKYLLKETSRLKTLNNHLDFRINEQEKRLSVVSLELTKTWHLVGKMQRQHRQLHTQEQILRYQLQQKRRLLSELKVELETCRRKWAASRAKNDESQEEYNHLRREFDRRKEEDANHSAESGYSDSEPQTEDEEHRTFTDNSYVSDCGEESGNVAGIDSIIQASTSGAVANNIFGDLNKLFNHSRQITRMQSTSPERVTFNSQNFTMSDTGATLRWNSAPPTCGWQEIGDNAGDGHDENKLFNLKQDLKSISKTHTHSSRSKQRSCFAEALSTNVRLPATSGKRTSRIQNLEKQCQSLIEQVVETSGNRERLEEQLGEISPVQHSMSLNEFISCECIERMTRARSVPISGSLTPREEEYTRKRSERLGRLEEESRQLMLRIKRTADRGHHLHSSLERIRRAPCTRKAKNNPQEEPTMSQGDACKTNTNTVNNLTDKEKEYTTKRSARLERLNEEGRQLIKQLSNNLRRGDTLGYKLEALHERYNAGGTEGDVMRDGNSNHITNTKIVSTSTKLNAEGESLNNVANTGEPLLNITALSDEYKTNDPVQAGSGPMCKDNESGKRMTIETDSPIMNNLAARSTSDMRPASTTEHGTSRIAKTQGAVPKIKSQVQLCAAQRQQDKRGKRDSIHAKSHERKNENDDGKDAVQEESESLEEMVTRLRSLPYPNAEASKEQTVEPLSTIDPLKQNNTETDTLE